MYSPKTYKNNAELLITPYPPEKGYAGVLITIPKDEIWNKEPKGNFDVMDYDDESDDWYPVKSIENVKIPELFLSKVRIMFSPPDISIIEQLKSIYIDKLFESLK